MKERLREELPRRVGERLRTILTDEGRRPEQIEAGVAQLRFGFEPADIVNEVMSFGSPTPIEVAVSGPDFAASRTFAAKVQKQLAQVPTLCDLQYVQSLNYPTVEVRVDRERAGLSGVTTSEVARALGLRNVVEPICRSQLLARPEERGGLPGAGRNSHARHRLGQRHRHGPRAGAGRRHFWCATWPAWWKAPCRANMTATTCGVVSLTANIKGEDLGHAASALSAAIKRAGEPPRGVTVDIRGQTVPLGQMFQGLGFGLVMAVLVIFLLLTAYFQSLPPRRDRCRGGAGRFGGSRFGLVVDRDHAQHPIVYGSHHGRRRGGRQRDSTFDLCRAGERDEGDSVFRRPIRPARAACGPS